MSVVDDFRSLHAPGQMLVLVNAFDVASAKVAELAGAKAIATSSASLAWAHGYADGETLPLPILLAAVGEIARVARVPVSVDSEEGFSAQPDQVADYAERLIDLGVAGINLEDGAAPADLTARKIEAIKERCARRGGDLFINARTDIYLKGLVASERALEETLARGRRYRDAGADGFFVPACHEPDALRRIAAEIALPLNALLMKASPAPDVLRAAGVRRLSTGAAPGRAAYAAVMRTAQALLGGDAAALLSATEGCPDFNGLFGAL